jgi:hypothetical protein
MAATKAKKPKLRKIKKVFAKKAIADINALIKAEEKLDLELKKIRTYIKKIMGHQYFA